MVESTEKSTIDVITRRHWQAIVDVVLKEFKPRRSVETKVTILKLSYALDNQRHRGILPYAPATLKAALEAIVKTGVIVEREDETFDLDKSRSINDIIDSLVSSEEKARENAPKPFVVVHSKKHYQEGNTIDLSNLNIKDLDEIDEIENLHDIIAIDISNNQFQKLPKLSNFPYLHFLYIDNNLISIAEGLEECPNLQEIYMRNNKLQEISGFGQCISIKKLWLSNNQISKITGIERLSNLVHLYLDHNLIDRIQGLASLEALTQIFLESNRIHGILELPSAIGNQNDMVGIYLDNNKLDGIVLDGSFSALQAPHNMISRVFINSSNIVQLQYLDLSNNKISDISWISAVRVEESFNLTGNNIQNCKIIESLPADWIHPTIGR